MHLAIVDVETTGADPAVDRITEIAVLEVRDLAVIGEWSTLVNPGFAIPAPVQALTGITQSMVEAAPRFARIAAELYERLDGRVLAAHNARFDYGFLRRELERAGIRYHAKTLCTVRLSRRLYPDAGRHDLDSLIARHALECGPRHRALPDAAAVWQFLRAATAEHGAEVLAVAARQVARQPALPPGLERAAIDAVPEAPGVYLLYGDGPAPLYIGKSRAMRSRILQHFVASSAWAPRVQRIEWQRTAGELGALLREAALVKALDPVHNRRPRALAGLEPPPWPHSGPLGVVEDDHSREATEVHVLDRWCYLGTARCDAEVAELLEERAPRFDYDQFRILSRHLGKRGVRVVELSA